MTSFFEIEYRCPVKYSEVAFRSSCQAATCHLFNCSKVQASHYVPCSREP